MKNNYSVVTETAGIEASQEQLSMLYTRYKFATEFCHGKDILEVACGAGQGLGYLKKVARRVIGGDIDNKNLELATRYYHERNDIEIKKIDAHQLPFGDQSIDVVILYEAIYYLLEPEKFIAECRRVLRKSGTLLISTANREWSDFNPSPFSIRYFSATELIELLKRHRFDVEILGGFPATKDSLRSYIISFIKRMAVSLHLIPKTMRGKQFLKRIFFGKLTPIPPEVIEDMACYAPPLPLQSYPTGPECKVIYAVGQLQA